MSNQTTRLINIERGERMKHFTKTEKAMLQNRVSVNDYLMRLMEMALSCFTWKNLPNTCDERLIERELLFRGQCLFFRDDELGDYLTLPFYAKGGFDIYGRPLNREAFSHWNTYRKSRTGKDSVIIYNNKMRTPYTINLMDFARRLYEVDRTMDVNLKAQKTPVLITGNEKQMNALKNLYKQYDGNEPVIFADKMFETSAISCLRTDAPYLCDKLWNLKTNIWNEALTYLGVSNVSIEKRERLVSDEVERNQGGTILNANIRLKERKDACDQINEMFGLNLDVVFNEDLVTPTEDETDAENIIEERVNINE